MPAYVVALIQRVTDPETYKSYVAQVEPTLTAFGGRFLARKPDPEPLEGREPPSRAIVIEFPDEASARAWHASPRYRPVMELRQSASNGMLLLLPGYGGVKPAVHDVCYVEHVTSEVPLTRAVLEATHGWAFSAPDEALGGSVLATLPNGGRVSIRAPLRPDEVPITRAYVRVASIEESVARAEKAGGKVALAPTELGPHGTIAILQNGGVDHGLWQLP